MASLLSILKLRVLAVATVMELGEAPLWLPSQGSVLRQQLAASTPQRGCCPQCRQLRPGSLSHVHVLLVCSRSELSPLISAASLNIRHTEEAGKDGVIQVHLLASHLKCSHQPSAIVASVSALPRLGCPGVTQGVVLVSGSSKWTAMS